MTPPLQNKRSIWNLLFLISSFGLGAMLGVAMVQELFPEWAGVQSAYYRRLAKVTGDRSKAGTPVKVLQIQLPEMKQVDRCVTCHVGISNPKMADQPQPFRSHPDLGIPGFLAKHSFDEMGCTVCHHGQGRATTKAAAHGPVHHWEEPMLPRDLTIGTCSTCHGNVMKLPGAERLAKAQRMFEEKGCIGCHQLNGQGMLIGPELSETARKTTDQFDFRYVQGHHTWVDWIDEHFKDPQKITPADPAIGIPESSMPNYDMTDEESRMLTALVLSFGSAVESEYRPIPARFKVPALPKEPEPVYASSIERGRAIYQKAGCIGCHGFEGRGGIRNSNMDLGEEVPPLTYVSEGFTREELKETIREGKYPARADRSGPTPPLWMPSWKQKLTDEEIDAVVDYLTSLNPDRPSA